MQLVLAFVYATWGALAWFVSSFGSEAFALSDAAQERRFTENLLIGIALMQSKEVLKVLWAWVRAWAHNRSGGDRSTVVLWLEHYADYASVQATMFHSRVVSAKQRPVETAQYYRRVEM